MASEKMATFKVVYKDDDQYIKVITTNQKAALMHAKAIKPDATVESVEELAADDEGIAAE